MRKCNGCTVCCTVTAVPELGKQVNKPCVFCAGKHCSIYSTRPASCAKFQCAWLLGDLPHRMRPDKVHVMIEKIPGKNVVLAIAEHGYETVWRTPMVDRALKAIYQANGIAVVASDRFALIPKGQTAEQVMRDVMSFARAVAIGAT